MTKSAPRASELRASLQRMQGYLCDALKDDWGANVLEEVLRHLEPVLADLDSRHARDASVRRRVSALGAQLQASAQARVFAMTMILTRKSRS